MQTLNLTCTLFLLPFLNYLTECNLLLSERCCQTKFRCILYNDNKASSSSPNRVAIRPQTDPVAADRFCTYISNSIVYVCVCMWVRVSCVSTVPLRGRTRGRTEGPSRLEKTGRPPGGGGGVKGGRGEEREGKEVVLVEE